jgi:3-phenylpropionate/trans-cinnamate dioxygenase ferredoxin subunit
VKNSCPHQGGPLCLGRTIGLVTSSGPGDFRYEREGEILRCPWHGWEFDLATGRSIVDPTGIRVKSYPVELEPEPESLQAETYPVEIEQETVIVVLT